MKFVDKLTEHETSTLTEAYKNHPSFRVRQRAHAVLLSDKGYRIIHLCEQLGVKRRETISEWLNRWAESGIIGLVDKPRSGRPRIFNDKEAERLVKLAQEEPHKLTAIATQLQKESGKKASIDTVKRLLKQRLSQDSTDKSA